MKQILTSLLMAIAMIFMGTTTAKADVSNEETGQYVLKCGNVSMTIDAAKGGKILSYKYGDKEVISQLKWPESFGSTFWTSPQKEWYWPPVPEYDKKPYQSLLVAPSGPVLRKSGIGPLCLNTIRSLTR